MHDFNDILMYSPNLKHASQLRDPSPFDEMGMGKRVALLFLSD